MCSVVWKASANSISIMKIGVYYCCFVSTRDAAFIFEWSDFPGIQSTFPIGATAGSSIWITESKFSFFLFANLPELFVKY